MQVSEPRATYGDRPVDRGPAQAVELAQLGLCLFQDLPLLVVWDLGFGPAIRLAANPGRDLDEADLDTLARACLRAVKRPD